MMLRYLTVGLVAVGLAGPAQADEITLAADAWCPYNCAPGSERPGYMVEIATQAFESAGHKLIYKTIPWARALAEAEAGRLAGVFGASPDEAPGLVYPKLPLAQSRSVLLVRAGDSFTWTSVKSLEPHALGIILDYTYGAVLDPYIKANLKNTNRIQVMGGDEPLKGNLRKLLAGRIGVTVDDAAVMAYEIADQKLADSVRMVDMSDAANPLYIGFAPKLPQAAAYAKRLDETVERLRASGDLEKILARYGLRDWESAKPASHPVGS
jgi:polar amino acid transport system substrate-binding protein